MSASACPLCLQDYTSWIGSRSKKQCNKCAKTVCRKCCEQRFLLPEVDRTKPKRVCDLCAKGGSVKEIDPLTLRLYTGVAKVEGGGVKKPPPPVDPICSPQVFSAKSGEAFTAGVRSPSAGSPTSAGRHARRPSLHNSSVGPVGSLPPTDLAAEGGGAATNTTATPPPDAGSPNRHLRRPSLEAMPPRPTQAPPKPPPPASEPPTAIHRPSLGQQGTRPPAPPVEEEDLPDPTTPLMPPPNMAAAKVQAPQPQAQQQQQQLPPHHHHHQQQQQQHDSKPAPSAQSETPLRRPSLGGGPVADVQKGAVARAPAQSLSPSPAISPPATQADDDFQPITPAAPPSVGGTRPAVGPNLLADIKKGTSLKTTAQAEQETSAAVASRHAIGGGLLADIQKGASLKATAQAEGGPSPVVSRPAIGGGLLADIQKGAALKATAHAEGGPPAVVVSRPAIGGGLLADIQKGAALKATAQAEGGPPAVVSRPAIGGGLLADIQKGAALKATAHAEGGPTVASRPAVGGNFLADIQKGASLKPVSQSHEADTKQPALDGGLLSAIQNGSKSLKSVSASAATTTAQPPLRRPSTDASALTAGQQQHQGHASRPSMSGGLLADINSGKKALKPVEPHHGGDKEPPATRMPMGLLSDISKAKPLKKVEGVPKVETITSTAAVAAEPRRAPMPKGPRPMSLPEQIAARAKARSIAQEGDILNAADAPHHIRRASNPHVGAPPVLHPPQHGHTHDTTTTHNTGRRPSGTSTDFAAKLGQTLRQQPPVSAAGTTGLTASDPEGLPGGRRPAMPANLMAAIQRGK